MLRGEFGWTLFGVIWGLAVAGVLLKAFYKTAHPIISTCLYLLMSRIAIGTGIFGPVHSLKPIP
ncbi:MAG: hypothetical protein WCA42_19860 [Desulfobacterales bacterium]